MNYTKKDIENILNKIITNEKFTIAPVGNHNIGRHLVYKIDTSSTKYIFKIYYIKGKRIREINSLKILENSNVKVPKVIKYGEYDEHEWMIIEYIEGDILDSISSRLDKENILSIFKELGEALGKVHSYRIFDYAAGWDKKIKANTKEKDQLYKSISEISGRPVFERLKQGPRSRTDRKERTLSNGEKTDIYGLVLYTLMQIKPGLEQIGYEKLRTSIKECVSGEPPSMQEISRVLDQMSKISIDDNASAPVLDWEREGQLHITDPFFSFFLKWGRFSE